jgi:DNA-binding MarR family transcriptional regulator
MNQNPDFTNLLQDWCDAFTRRTMQDFMRFAHQHQLSMAQLNILLHLHYRGPTEIVALRRNFYGSRAAASQMIDRLVQLGLASRDESSADRRVKVVSLTQQGELLIHEAIAARKEWLDQLAGSFSSAQKAMYGEMLLEMLVRTRELEEGQSSIGVIEL